MTKEQLAFLVGQLDAARGRRYHGYCLPETAEEKKLRHELERLKLRREQEAETVREKINVEYDGTKELILDGDWTKARAAVAKFKNFMRGYRH